MVKKALKSLPKTLYETYDRILLNINEEDRRDALRVLQWLSFSVRPISVEEGVEVLATDPDAGDGVLFDPDRRPFDPRQIAAICPSLVTIIVTDVGRGNVEAAEDEDTSIDSYWEHITELTELRLAHFSVREYLISDYLRLRDDKLSFYYFNKRIAETTIARTCLAYLLQFNQPGCIYSSTRESSPLSDYAAVHWMEHAGQTLVILIFCTAWL